DRGAAPRDAREEQDPPDRGRRALLRHHPQDRDVPLAAAHLRAALARDLRAGRHLLLLHVPHAAPLHELLAAAPRARGDHVRAGADLRADRGAAVRAERGPAMTRAVLFGCYAEGDGYPRPRLVREALEAAGVSVVGECRVAPGTSREGRYRAPGRAGLSIA